MTSAPHYVQFAHQQYTIVPLSKCRIYSLNFILVKFDHSNAMECLDIRPWRVAQGCVRVLQKLNLFGFVLFCLVSN